VLVAAQVKLGRSNQQNNYDKTSKGRKGAIKEANHLDGN